LLQNNYFGRNIDKNATFLLKNCKIASTGDPPLDPEVGAQIKNCNAQAQIAQRKFLIGKTQAQIAQLFLKI